MTLSEEQVREIKKQIFEQIENFPRERKQQIEEQVNSMNAEELELFVRDQMSGQSRKGGTQKGIFRMIVDGDVPSKKIDENKEAIAVISVKAVSKGHVLIIPKKVVGDGKLLPSSIFSLAKKIANRISVKLKSNSVEIQTERVFGEVIVNVIPVYDKPVNADSHKSDVSDAELEEVYEKLRIVKKEKVIRIKKEPENQEKILKLSRRIP